MRAISIEHIIKKVKMGLIPIYTWTKGLHIMHKRKRSFMLNPWASGGLLLLCVILAMLLANLPFTKDIYHSFLETELTIHVTNENFSISFPREMTVEKFINDILMVVFFFSVGLEIKREIKIGELSSLKKAMLPVIAAAGGMAMPAIIYTLTNSGTMAESGWGIPTATDIAFAVAILSVFGSRVPTSLKIFLTALAIADDLGAILVVALFYGESINLILLGIALIVIAIARILNNLGEKRIMFYLIPAIAVWFLFYYSGIHATMSGVVMAFMIPMKSRYSRVYFNNRIKNYLSRIIKYDNCENIEDEEFPNSMQRHCLRRISHVSSNTVGMSYRLEHRLTPWINFCIMPIFALANAGVTVPDLSYMNIFQYSPEIGSVSMGVFLGLVLGKPIGITLASFLAIKFKFGEMPDKATWKMLFAVACLGGIGFTMSIFIDTLSFGELQPEMTQQLCNMGKMAVLMGSLCSALLGCILIYLFSSIKSQSTKI